MKKIEHKAIEMLKSLIKLTDPKDKNYNKVMFYETLYNMHGREYPLNAFAENIEIRYGTMDMDGGNAQLKQENATSSKPSENTDEVAVNINSLGTKNIEKFLAGKGLKGNYPRYLAVVLRKGSYKTKIVLMKALTDKTNIDAYNKKQNTRRKRVSESLVDERTKQLMEILDSDLNFIL